MAVSNFGLRLLFCCFPERGLLGMFSGYFKRTTLHRMVSSYLRMFPGQSKIQLLAIAGAFDSSGSCVLSGRFDGSRAGSNFVSLEYLLANEQIKPSRNPLVTMYLFEALNVIWIAMFYPLPPQWPTPSPYIITNNECVFSSPNSKQSMICSLLNL